jgi:FkbM family methyltransferase
LTLRDLDFDLPSLVQKKNPVVIDVGANRGQTIDLVHRTFAKPIIFSFEANPELSSTLRDKYEPYGVTIEGCALGKSEGTVAFHISENSELSSVLDLNRSGENPFLDTRVRRRVNVPVMSLDSWVEKKGLKYIDLLKVDTQGSDLEVLRGASATLSQHLVGTLLVEVNFICLYEGQCSFGELETFLKGKGYGLVALYEIVRTRGHISWATACFQRVG